MTYHALIVEDNDGLAHLFALWLAHCNFKTVIVQTGTAGTAYLQEHTPDLVVLDLMLPEMNGEEVLTWIRGQPTLDTTKVIVVSAYPRWAQDLETAADLVLFKPVSAEQFRKFAEFIVTH